MKYYYLVVGMTNILSGDFSLESCVVQSIGDKADIILGNCQDDKYYSHVRLINILEITKEEYNKLDGAVG